MTVRSTYRRYPYGMGFGGRPMYGGSFESNAQSSGASTADLMAMFMAMMNSQRQQTPAGPRPEPPPKAPAGPGGPPAGSAAAGLLGMGGELVSNDGKTIVIRSGGKDYSFDVKTGSAIAPVNNTTPGGTSTGPKVIGRFADGKQLVQNPDGSVKILNPDGSEFQMGGGGTTTGGGTAGAGGAGGGGAGGGAGAYPPPKNGSQYTYLELDAMSQDQRNALFAANPTFKDLYDKYNAAVQAAPHPQIGSDALDRNATGGVNPPATVVPPPTDVTGTTPPPPINDMAPPPYVPPTINDPTMGTIIDATNPLSPQGVFVSDPSGSGGFVPYTPSDPNAFIGPPAPPPTPTSTPNDVAPVDLGGTPTSLGGTTTPPPPLDLTSLFPTLGATPDPGQTTVPPEFAYQLPPLFDTSGAAAGGGSNTYT